MDKIIKIYLDESGAFHIKNKKYFVIAGYLVIDDKSPKRMFQKFEKKYNKNSCEFKACYSDYQLKKYFVRKFILKSYKPIAIVCDKTKIDFKILEEDTKYNYLVKILIHSIIKKLSKIINKSFDYIIEIKCDNRSQKIESKNSLQDYLRSESIGWSEKYKINIKNINLLYCDSSIFYQIRISDFIANYTYCTLNIDYKNISFFSSKFYVFLTFPYKK